MSDANDTVPPIADASASVDDRNIAMLTHISGFILSVIVPLIVWLSNKDKPGKAFLIDQSKEALNFQITLLFVYIAGWVLTAILIGTLITFLAWVAAIVFGIVAGLKAKEGVAYRYPYTLRLIA